MPLDALQREIAEEAGRKADAIEEKARKEADAILKSAKARADAADSEFERELKEEIGRIGLEYRSSREMQEKNILLSARERLTEDLVDRVRAAVTKRVREKGYKRLFDSAMREAQKISPMKDLTLVMDKQDAKFAKGFTGRITYARIDGLVIYAAGDKIKIDATLDTLFDRNRDLVKEAIRRGVFGEKAGGAAARPSARRAVKKAAKPKAKPGPARKPKRK